MLTGYEDLLRRKRSTFRKISASLITLGIILLAVAFILWIPFNENTVDDLLIPSYGSYFYGNNDNLGYLKDWSLPAQFDPVYSDLDTTDYMVIEGKSSGSMSASHTIIIPAIDLASDVEPLVLMDDEKEPYYANPKNVVGHLPTSVNPGEQGAVWRFGHLESPFTSEGAVLWDIPKLENELNSDNNINVILENDSNRFIYRVSSISIVEEADFEIYQSDGSTLHIVTCYPRLKYDKRMIVNADLVGLDSIFD